MAPFPEPPPPAADAAVADEPAVLVSDAAALRGALARLAANNDAIIFWNAEESFRILLRNDPVDQEVFTFDLSILCEEDDAVHRMLQTEHDGYFDEPGVFTFETLSVSSSSTADSDDVQHVLAQINEMWAYKICPCGAYLVKDGGAQCTFCDLTMTKADGMLEFCPICHENSIRKHMTRQQCCSQYMHTACLETWLAKSDSGQCPLCRGE